LNAWPDAIRASGRKSPRLHRNIRSLKGVAGPALGPQPYLRSEHLRQLARKSAVLAVRLRPRDKGKVEQEE
jgi:hypothetical protein